MFGLRRKTAGSKRGDPPTSAADTQGEAEPEDSAGADESAAAQATDQNSAGAVDEPAGTDAQETSPKDIVLADDPMPLDESDEIVAADSDSPDANPPERVEEMPNMQSDEPNADVDASLAGENPNADRAILHIGPGTVLKGDITTCESLIVQGNLNGTVEASLMLLAHGGVVDGTVNVQAAEIEGTFTGTLTVKGLLCVKGGGQIQGTVRYGELEIERGCQLNGDISQHEASSGKSASNVSRVRGANPAGVKAA